MASRKTPKRIEPHFENGASVGELPGARNRAKASVKAANKIQTAGGVPKIRGPSARSAAKSRRPARTRRIRRIRKLTYWGLVLGVWGLIGLVCLVAYHAAKLPQMSAWSVPERPPNVRIVSVEGGLLANRGMTGGESLRLDEMSPWLPMAVIAIEDRRFNRHAGVDPLGLARAMLTNVVAGRLAQGGSTLTQQLAKNLFLEPERTVGRKIQEAVLAIWLETRFSKDEILELYLNRVYFGSGAYGVDAAARRYFSKSARDLTLAESAVLAGLVKAPSRLSPARDPKAAEARAELVLAAMRREGFITADQAARALAMKPAQARRYINGGQQFVADMIMAQLPGLIGGIRADLIVDASIDLDLQAAAERAIGAALNGPGARLDVSQGALVALDGTGAVRALVGGREYAKSQFNRALDAKRQPGSAFKPIVYLAALEAGRTPDTVRQDEPVRIGDWTPENYDKKFRGPVTLNTALSQSLNTIAAQMVAEIGPKAVADTAFRLGIRSALQRNASIALGTSEVTLMELTSAYASFANGGYAVSPWLIRRVMTSSGKVIFERDAQTGAQVVRARELGMMNAMLSDVIANGTGRRASLKERPAAGKTGTTQNSRDAWFVGYTASLTAGLWFGNDDGTPMKNVTGATLPAEAWAQFMTAAHKDIPVAGLAGVYRPQFGVLPAPRPGAPLDDENDAEGVALSRQEQSLPPLPGAGIGARKKPRNLLELLFGG